MTFLDVICYGMPVKILLVMRSFMDSCTLKDLYKNTHKSPGNLAKKMLQLRDLELVEITHNGLRGRASNRTLKLTEKGRTVADKLYAINALTESGVAS